MTPELLPTLLAGLHLTPCGAGWLGHCPAHGDSDRSLSVGLGRDGQILLHCHAGCSLEAVCRALGISIRDLFSGGGAPPPEPGEKPVRFTKADAEYVWRLARTRARNDDLVDQDERVYQYVAERGLGDAWELGLYGILPPDVPLPSDVAKWPGSDHRLIAPLYDEHGVLQNVQGRSVGPVKPKVRFPKGSTARGLFFANEAGLELLRGERPRETIVFGEGLTDHLALSVVTCRPVLCAPGTGFVKKCPVRWAQGHAVLLAFDGDLSGQKAAAIATGRLRAEGVGAVRQLTFPAGAKDACDALRRLGAERFGRELDGIIQEVRRG